MRHRVSVLSLLAALAVPAEAQVRVFAPGGTLSGVVQDSASGLPIGYALIVLTASDRRIFAGEAGRFTLRGVGAGPLTLRVQQIGYRPRTLVLQVDVHPGPAEGALTLRLERQPLVLPELRSDAASCPSLREAGRNAPEGESILDEAFKNAERILTLERKYPFVLDYQLTTLILDSSQTRIGGTIDTVRRESRKYAPYRAGQLLDRGGTRFEKVNAFTTSAVAGAEFQRTHCFWYGGRDSAGPYSGFRIAFAPRRDIRSLDWAGAFLVDSASMALLKAEARVVNIPARGTNFLSVVCTIFYQPILPSLPQEAEAKCISAKRGPPRQFLVEHWRLVNRTFLEREPGTPVPR